MMRVDLIRHGQTAGNREKRYVGSTDEPLTEQARQEAADLHLVRPDLLVVSPMRRCRETAGILYPGMTQIVIDDLRECSFGRFEYKNWQELTDDPDYQAWIDSGGTIGFPGGESRDVFTRRSLRGFRAAVSRAERSGAQRLAVVAHGGTIMAVLSALGRPERDYFDWQCRNLAGWTALLQDGFLCRPEQYGSI